ncbi:MAG TPA: oligoendopeptidase F [Symbiobacteriaceae bacterium]|nr:oligoendopeptidase F [Symbiobacteriaceae bacterium]
MAKRPARREVPVEQTWDLQGLYPTTAAWEADLAKVDSLLPTATAYQGRLSEGAATLLACLKDVDVLSELAMQVFWFAYNSCTVEQGNPEVQALRDKGMAMTARAQSALAFIKPEILALPDGTVTRYLEEEPGLAMYRLYLFDILAEKEHMLSADAEGVIAALGEVTEAPYIIWQNTTAADITFDPVKDENGVETPMSVAAMFKLLQSPDRTVRQAAYESAMKGFMAHKRTIAATLATANKRDVILAKLRRYPSALHAALAESHLPAELFMNLLKVSEAGAHHLQRYNEFRRKELGVETLEGWDLNAPLDADVDAEITYRDACSMIIKALAPLGPEYRAILEQAIAGRWVDWSDNEGKEAGAYSWGCYGYHPIIMMTWQDKIADAFTLAHELGHTVHSVLSARKQPYIYSDYSNFLAEMASTTNELLLARYLLQTTTDRKLRRYVLTRALSAFTSNFWGGSMMAAMQLWMHEAVEQGEPLTFESITAKQVEVNKRWYGETVNVTPDLMGVAWLRVLHHFRNFYSYQYATGISAAAAFADAILSEGAPAVERYLGFLSAGSSAHPIDILKAAGLDMTTPEPVEKAVAYFGRLVTELEKA